MFVYRNLLEQHGREDLARVHGRFESDLIPEFASNVFVCTELFVSGSQEKSQLEQIMECERLFP